MTKQAISDADLAFMFANHMREILAHPDHLSREHLVELAFAAAGMIDGASTLDEPLIHIRQSPYITACAQTIAEVRLNVITAVASAKMGEDIVFRLIEGKSAVICRQKGVFILLFDSSTTSSPEPRGNKETPLT